MNYVKMLGLAAVAAMALTAFFGASSASATVLCKTATNPCGSAWIYSGSLEGSVASGSSWVQKSTGGSLEDTCFPDIGGSTVSQGANQNVVVSVNRLNFTTCSKSTFVLEETGSLELEGTTVNAKGFKVTVEAVSGVSCVYSAGTGTTLGTFTGGNPAIIGVNAVVNKVSGSFLCPSDSKWEGTWVITGIGTLHSEPS